MTKQDKKGEQMSYPKFEKVNAHTIRVIKEEASDVPLDKLLEAKQQLEDQKTIIEERLKNINRILQEATKLGVTPKPEVKNDRGN
jgi:hypothetical protein